MSIYSKLNSLLTAANNKTGESDTTLTDAVQTLIDGYGQGGGGDTLYIRSDNSSFNNMWPNLDAVGIKTVNIDCNTWSNRQIPGLVTNINVETINLTYAQGLKPNSMRDFFRGGLGNKDGGVAAHVLKRVNLINVDTSGISDWFAAFIGVVPSGCVINGTLDLSSYSSGNPFNGGSGIAEMRFQPNALTVGMTISKSNGDSWSDDTWVSFANNLKAGSAILTIGSDLQTRLAGIMGTVTDGTFTKNSGGSVSLQSFITGTKGWTLS